MARLLWQEKTDTDFSAASSGAITVLYQCGLIFRAGHIMYISEQISRNSLFNTVNAYTQIGCLLNHAG